MVVHGGGGQQYRYGDMVRIHAAVRQDQNIVSLTHRLLCSSTQPIQSRLQASRSPGSRITDIRSKGAEGTLGQGIDLTHPRQAGVGGQWSSDLQPLLGRGLFQLQQIRAWTDL